MDDLHKLDVIDDSVGGRTSFLKLWIHRNCSLLRLDGSQEDSKRIDDIEQTIQFLRDTWKANGGEYTENRLELKATILSAILNKDIGLKVASPANKPKLLSDACLNGINEKTEANRRNPFLNLPNETLSTIFYEALHVEGVRVNRHMNWKWLCICKRLFPIVLRELSADPIALNDRRSMWAFLRMLNRVRVEDIRHLTIRVSPGNVFDDGVVSKIVGLCSRITTLSINPYPYRSAYSGYSSDSTSKADSIAFFADILQTLQPVKNQIRTLYLADNGSTLFWTVLKAFPRVTHLGLHSGYLDARQWTQMTHLGRSSSFGVQAPESDMDLSEILPSQLTTLRTLGDSSLIYVMQHIKQANGSFPSLHVLDFSFGSDIELMYYILEAISPSIQDLSVDCDNTTSHRFYNILAKCTELKVLKLNGLVLTTWDVNSAGVFQPSLRQLTLHRCAGKAMNWGLWKLPLKGSQIKVLILSGGSYTKSMSETEKWSATRSTIVKYCRGKGIDLVLPKKGEHS
ncbi:hypothetical protein BT69DRAFT_1321788 [Atractiella rhizophila]|nr:hypothetical protein BT69DRAFT_1321788 [Atractiella rhizophila]